MKAVLPNNEMDGFEVTYQDKILEPGAKEAFDDFTLLAAQICEVPTALITLLDHNRQQIHSQYGLTLTQTTSEIAFCAHVVLQADVFIVPDALADERFAADPLVISDPYIRFYAGVPFITSQGYTVGTLSIIDYIPRELTSGQLARLQTLSRQVIRQLELRQNLVNLEHTARESERLERKLRHRELELLDVFENGPSGLHCLDANGIILWANQSELDLLGYTRQEYVGHPAANFYADKAVIEDILKRLAANETLHNYEARMLCKDGSTRYVLINSNVLWEDGKFSHTRCFTRDISERKLAEEALRQTQERFRNLVETSSDWVWEVDENAVYTYASPKVRDVLGYEPEEVIGKTPFDWMPAEEARRVADIFAPIAAQALPFSCLENLNIHKDGHLVVLETSGIPFFNAEGKFRGYRGMDRDITRRKSVEAELRDLGAALENAVEGISRLDAQGRYIAVNKSYANTHGYEPEELIGMEWQLTVHPEDVDKLTEAYQQMLVSGKVESEARGIRKGGAVFYKQVVMIAAYDGQKQFLGHHCFMKDISDRKRTEQKIREQAALLDVATEAIFVHSLDNKILFWNKGAERLYGWKREEVVGKNAWKLLYQNSQSQQEIQKTLLEKGEWQGELHKVTKDNKDIIVASRLTLVRDALNQPKSILVVNSDITEKKQLEAQFLRTQRMESIGTLAGGIAHDLNNVLAPILMAVQLLQLKLTDERCQQWLDILETSARRGADLVKQVVSFARGMDGDRTIVQVRHILSEIRQIARETFPKSIEMYIDVSQDLWAVSGDATQLHQVLMNLCVNARDALPDGGTLSIYAENLLIDEDSARMNIEAKVGAYVVVTVSDTGIGIPPETLDRIFEPFFTTKEIGKGTGLGLSTVMGIIKSHGGFIDVYSEIGKGTEFKIYLPALEETEARSFEELDPPAGQGELILVVDDEVSIRTITKTALENHHYRVLTASDGIEAIALYAQHKKSINAVLIDIMMPEMDGSTTIRTLRKMEPEVKIIAVSGLVSTDKLAQLAMLEVNTFLSKPYTTIDLLKSLHTVLNPDI